MFNIKILDNYNDYGYHMYAPYYVVIVICKLEKTQSNIWLYLLYYVLFITVVCCRHFERVVIDKFKEKMC